jgi:hypothetical protein
VKDLRDAICHLHLEAIPIDGEVEKLKFWTCEKYSGFQAEIPLEELRKFVGKMADFLATK